MTHFLAVGAAVLAGIGLAAALTASRLVVIFARQRLPVPFERPPVTVLKPLHGDEPLLEAALTTVCQQNYPLFQIVFGVQDAADPAVRVVRRLQVRFPDLDLKLVIDPRLHGRNRKVGNLINMMAEARHDVLVIADADVHVRTDYLDCLVAALQQAGTGLVTALYGGLPVRVAAAGGETLRLPGHDRQALPTRLGATAITYGFLPSAVLARALGRQDCLGATMCLRRDDLDNIGGFHALVDHLADDNVLGRRIKALGLKVALANTVILTTVPETRFAHLFRHELRWARTIRALEPAGFVSSVLQYPLVWSMLTIPLTRGASWSFGCFLLAWVVRAVAALGVDNALTQLWTGRSDRDANERQSPDSEEAAALAFSCPVWLLPLRDLFSVTVMLVSYGSRRVDWRGHDLHADTPPPFTHQSVSFRSLEGTNAR